MDVQISKNLWLDTSDEKNFTLYEKKITTQGKNKGSEYRDVIGYFANFENACARALKIITMRSDIDDILQVKDVVKDAIEEIKYYIKQALKEK